MYTEPFPCRTVYAHVVHVGDEDGQWRGSWLGFSAVEDTFGLWTVLEVHDIGVTRQFEPLQANFPDRETAEAYCLALVEAHTPTTAKAA